jgi:hypothetical protein
MLSEDRRAQRCDEEFFAPQLLTGPDGKGIALGKTRRLKRHCRLRIRLDGNEQPLVRLRDPNHCTLTMVTSTSGRMPRSEAAGVSSSSLVIAAEWAPDPPRRRRVGSQGARRAWAGMPTRQEVSGRCRCRAEVGHSRHPETLARLGVRDRLGGNC